MSAEPWPRITVHRAAGERGPARELVVRELVGGIVYASWSGLAGVVRFRLASGQGIAEVAAWHIERHSLDALRAEESRRFHETQPYRVARAHFRHSRKGYR